MGSPIWRQVIERVWDTATSALKTKVISSVLPTGSSTEATLSSMNSKLVSQTSSTSTISRVSSSASSVQILAANASRLGGVFYNDSTSACYLKLGTTASSTSYTFKMDAKSTVI